MKLLLLCVIICGKASAFDFRSDYNYTFKRLDEVAGDTLEKAARAIGKQWLIFFQDFQKHFIWSGLKNATLKLVVEEVEKNLQFATIANQMTDLICSFNEESYRDRPMVRFKETSYNDILAIGSSIFDKSTRLINSIGYAIEREKCTEDDEIHINELALDVFSEMQEAIYQILSFHTSHLMSRSNAFTFAYSSMERVHNTGIFTADAGPYIRQVYRILDISFEIMKKIKLIADLVPKLPELPDKNLPLNARFMTIRMSDVYKIDDMAKVLNYVANFVAASTSSSEFPIPNADAISINVERIADGFDMLKAIVSDIRGLYEIGESAENYDRQRWMKLCFELNSSSYVMEYLAIIILETLPIPPGNNEELEKQYDTLMQLFRFEPYKPIRQSKSRPGTKRNFTY